MIKVKRFGIGEPLEDGINEFIANESLSDTDVIDIKYSTCFRGDIDWEETALLIYKC